MIEGQMSKLKAHLAALTMGGPMPYQQWAMMAPQQQQGLPAAIRVQGQPQQQQ